jgi:hypothetical protein
MVAQAALARVADFMLRDEWSATLAKYVEQPFFSELTLPD